MRFATLAAAGLAFAPPALEGRGPPARPPWRKGYGEYCFRASCDVQHQGCPVARVVGYDRYVTVAQDVERACRAAAPDGHECSAASVTLLTRSRKECGGHVFYIETDGTARRLLAP